MPRSSRLFPPRWTFCPRSHSRPHRILPLQPFYKPRNLILCAHILGWQITFSHPYNGVRDTSYCSKTCSIPLIMMTLNGRNYKKREGLLKRVSPRIRYFGMCMIDWFMGSHCFSQYVASRSCTNARVDIIATQHSRPAACAYSTCCARKATYQTWYANTIRWRRGRSGTKGVRVLAAKRLSIMDRT